MAGISMWKGSVCMDFIYIQTNKDIKYFLDKTNSLHDGYIISVQYTNKGIRKVEKGHYFSPELTKLTLQILVTSIYDTIVEIEFENLIEWQVKSDFSGIFETSIAFDDKGLILWSDDIFVDKNDMKRSSYVIAGSMKWRFVE